MAFGLVAIRDSTNGGVYYCANFTTSGAITWTKLTTTGLGSLVIDEFKVDPFNPRDRQYVLADNVLYGRNGGNWSSLITLAQARTLTGWSSAGDEIKSVWCDPTIEGVVYIVYNGNTIGTGESAIIKSTNYGSTWAIQSLPSTNRQFFDLQVYGNTIWLTHDPSAISNPRIYYSTNGGSSYVNATALARGIMARYPHTTAQALGLGPSALGTLNTDLHVWNATPAATKLQDNLGQATANQYGGSWATGEAMWVDPYTANHERLIMDVIITSPLTVPMCYTTDGWATYTQKTITLAGGTAGTSTQVTHLQNLGDTTAVIFGISGSASGAYRSSIYALDNEADTTATSRNGANSETTYVDSVPSNLMLAYRTPIWVGEQPVSTGVYVYSVEMEGSDATWDTDVTDYTKIGSPMGGDRASFRDMPADGFDVYHAEDVHAATPQIHAPWDSASPPGNGYGIISDGTKWEVSSAPIALTSDLHDAVTLDSDAAVILDLTGQEIGLDTQAANTVLAGPTTGAANEPTFRALVSADLPAIALNDLSDVDTSGVDADDILVYDGANWVDRRPNYRKRITITADTTLDDTYDVVIVDASSNDVDVQLPSTATVDEIEYAIKRIDSSANTVSVLSAASLLIDDSGDYLIDDDGDYLMDDLGGSDTIDGELSVDLAQYSSMQIVADADAETWWII